MKGIILAAGRGSRLNQLTENQPKPLVKLAGKSLFAWQTAALKAAGITDLTVITGYRGEQFGNYDIPQIHNPHWATSNMVRSLLAADDLLQQDECVVSYGDIVYHPEIVRKLFAVTADIAISYDTAWLELWSQRFANPLTDAESFYTENGRLVDIGRSVTDISEIAGQYMGLLLFRPKGWLKVKQLLNEYTPQQIDKLDMTTLLSRLLEAKVTIETVSCKGQWLELDDLEDLALYKAKLNQNIFWQHDWRWSRE